MRTFPDRGGLSLVQGHGYGREQIKEKNFQCMKKVIGSLAAGGQLKMGALRD
jgi:hypothetical protein